MTKTLRMKRLAGALALVLATAPAFAQQTSGTIAGRVTNDAGTPVSGAEVVIVHEPSGTTSRAVTDADGRYVTRNLRVGGPYTVTVTGNALRGESDDDVSVGLNATTAVNFDLEPATTLETVQVVAQGMSQIFSPEAMGTGTNLNEEQIRAFPSINRSLQDYARLDPRVTQTDKSRGEISALGQNNRFNSITIDGVTTNDTFGLESNNLPTSGQPMSIDTLEAFDIAIADYDVTQTGYTGVRINAVTKSGTNEFHGSVYGVYRDSDWVGDGTTNTPFAGFDDERTVGVTFGGPILKDRLFFFASYEDFQRSAPGPSFGPIGSNASNIVNIAQADIDRARSIASTVYGVDVGGFDVGASDTTDDKILVKFDWNINDFHRASFRYNKVDESTAIFPNLDRDDLSFSSQWYAQEKSFENYVVNLYNDWSDSFSSEASLSYRDYQSAPITNSRLPQVQIDIGSNQLNFGTEQFRHANLLETQTLTGFWAGSWYVGDHEIKFGLDYQDNDIFNLFTESSLGRYRFGSLDNFQNGVYREYVLRTPAPGFSLADTAADWTLQNLGVFAQDTWSPTYNLSLMFGLRLDRPIVDDEPLFNQAVLDTYGLRNDTTIDGNELVQPRFGFNYTFESELSAQARGGVGLFQGSAANVWLSNPFSNNGRSIFVYGCGSGGLASCNNQTLPPPSFDPDQQPLVVVGGQPRGDVDIVSPDLDQPSVWKANLAFDQELPWWNMVATAELVVLKTNTAIYYEHLNLGDPTRVGQDGRELYWNAAGYNPANFNQFGNTSSSSGVRGRAGANRAFNDVLLARPTHRGDARALTVSLQKPYVDHWFWQLAYTFSDADEVNSLTSSRAISNWGNNIVFNHANIAARANTAVQDRFTGAIAWRNNFFGDYKTEFSVFYEGRSGHPFSYVFDNDANGDGRFGNDLLYIPAGPGDVQFGSAAEEAAFWDYVNGNEYLRTHLGQVAGKNVNETPWVHNFDVRLSQQLPGFIGDNRFEIWLDVLNIGNLIDDDWGTIEEVGFPFGQGIVEYGGIDPATGRYVYRFNNPDTLRLRDETGQSRWAVQVGLRYDF